MSDFQKNVVNSWFGETLIVQGKPTKASEVLTDELEVLGMYFSAHWCSPCRKFTPKLCSNYTALKEAGKKIEFIFLSSDEDEEAFNEYHGSMTFPALPFDQSDMKEEFSAKYGVRGIPCLVLVNAKTGDLITKDGREIISHTNFINKFPDPYGPPKEDPFSRPVSEWFGTTLLVKGEERKASDIINENVEVLGLYFSAHWCPPCRGFTPALSSKYEQLKEAGKKFDIVFISSDRDEEAFSDYHKEMTFPAMPYPLRDTKEDLSEKFGVQGIPSLIFIDAKTGETISKDGRAGISTSNFIENFPYRPKPVNDISETLSELQEKPSLLVFCDHSEDSTKRSITEMLTEFAVDSKKNDTIPIKNYFTVKGEGGPVSQIKNLLKMRSWPEKYTKGELKEEEITPTVYCDGCGKNGSEFKKRYGDKENNFDYCETCYQNQNEPIPDDIKFPSMAILDLSDTPGGGYYFPAEGKKDVNKENISTFIAAYKDKSLEKKQNEKIFYWP